MSDINQVVQLSKKGMIKTAESTVVFQEDHAFNFQPPKRKRRSITKEGSATTGFILFVLATQY